MQVWADRPQIIVWARRASRPLTSLGYDGLADPSIVCVDDGLADPSIVWDTMGWQTPQ